jgi:hypothetical protein
MNWKLRAALATTGVGALTALGGWLVTAKRPARVEPTIRGRGRSLHDDRAAPAVHVAGDRMIPAAYAWKTNAHLIEDVAKLGYLDGSVLDLTPGLGVWWKRWKPEKLTLNHDDFRSTGWFADSFDAVAYDPPYKLNGTPTPGVDARYGVHIPTPWEDRINLMRAGLDEAIRLAKPGGHVLMKCQDQVSSGKVRWQTVWFTNAATMSKRTELVDRFDMLGTTRPQPMAGRRQCHAHGRPSTLLVFRKATS